MYTLYKDRWILDENGVAIAQRCRGATNRQWLHILMSLGEKLDKESRERVVDLLIKT